MSDEDPFDCFGDDDDDDVNANADDDNRNDELMQRRNPSNGILSFHAGTEKALLHHVEEKMRQETHTGGAQETAALVLGHIDEFCLQRHWMMHVGHEKSPIIQGFLKECCDAHGISSSPGKVLRVLEIGTYCGYSSILIARSLKSLGCHFRLLSVEVVPENVQVAKRMVELAGLDDCVDILLLNPEKESLQALLERSMESSWSYVDFLFLDHDKSLYLRDLQELEQSGYVKNGCFVAADNVVFAQINDYRQYMAELEKKEIVRTRLAMSWLEYCEPDHNGDEEKKNMMRDGIELSIYQKDPC